MLAALGLFGWGVSAQTTFNVDMTCAPEGFTDVFVTGPWCGWCANDVYNTMTDDDGDGIYSVTVADLTGTVEYKYAINGFDDQENLINDMVDGATCAPVTDFSGYANRTTEANSTTNDAYGTCDGTCNDAAPADQVDVTFQVDLNDYTGAYGTVNLNGSFTGWCGACAAMTDVNADGVYDLTVSLAPGTYEYKFTLDGWTAQEEFADGDPCTSTIDGFVNRTVDITAAATLPVVCYNSCDACDGTGGGDNGGGDNGGGTDPTSTTFNVDMSCATAAGAMTNGTTEITEVFVTGPWCGWCSADGYNVLSDADGDGIFSVEIADLTGDVEYKYGVNAFADQEQLVDDMVDGGTCAPITDFSGFANRQMAAGSTANDVFGSCSACGDNGGGDNGGGTDPVDPVDVTFQVDLNDYSGAYGTVNLNGSFNGWCGACAAMTDSNADGVYDLTVSLAPGTYEYKFTLDGWTAQEEFTDGDPCTSTIDGYVNRTVDITAAATLSVVCYNSCDACDGSGGGDNGGGTDPTTTTFNVDMSCATEAGATLNGATEITEVFVTGPWCGWCAADGYNVLTDADGDGIFSVEIADLTGDVEYKYGINGFDDQEQLVDDMVDGGTCAPITDFSGYANRQIAAGSTADDVFGSCSACDNNGGGDNGGGTDPTSTTFNVDMSCATAAGAMTNGTTEITEVFVTGPWCGWCSADGYNVLTDADGDGIFSVEIADLTGDVEYKYAVNAFADQEQLVDDMVDGGTCAPITDFSGFANRQTTAGSTTNDVYGTCGICEDSAGTGCTDPAYVEFDPYATTDDGSCGTLAVYGCPYEAAINYNPLANVDDLSCEFELVDNSCPADLDGDGSVTTTDLLSFLASFGANCL